MNRRHTLAATLVLLTFLTACDGGDPPPPAQTTSSSVSSPPRPTTIAAKAPPVTNPLAAPNFVVNPCRSLTEAQQKQFALDNARLSDIAVEGNSCFYRQNGDKAKSVSVTFAGEEPDGLSSRYQEHVSGTWTFWDPTTVDGYPAVGFDADDSANLHPLFCSFAIGVADSLYFWVSADDAPGAAKCSAAKEVASAVLATVKAGG